MSLVERRQLSQSALERVITENYPELLRRARRLHPWAGSDGAQDFVQEAIVSAIGSRDFDPNRPDARAFLHKVLHRRGVDHIRSEEVRKGSERKVGLINLFPTEIEAEVIERVDRPIDRDRVRAALKHVTPRQRDIIELVYYRGLSFAQAAEKLGITKSTATSVMRDARTVLRSLLEEK